MCGIGGITCITAYITWVRPIGNPIIQQWILKRKLDSNLLMTLYNEESLLIV